MSLKARALDGSDINLERSAMQSLTSSVRGVVMQEGDPGYEKSRTLWNGMIDRRPALVVRCLGVGDVIAAVKFARQTGIALSIRGGGHNIAGLAAADGALMIDMSAMRGVFVDPERRIAHAQPGCLLGDVDRETQLHGLAAVLGFVSNTGIAGLTLGGGFGYLTRKYGWTTDNVRSLQVVTAEGEVIRASEKNEPDLFWALRGGGGNFGVVTDFEYDLHRVGPSIQGGVIAWRIEDAAEVLAMYQELSADAPPELVCTAGARLAPAAPWLSREVHGKPIVLFTVCDHGPADAAEARMKRIKSFGKPVGDVIQARPYTSMQSMFDAAQPNGRRYYWKSEYAAGVTKALLDTCVTHGEKAPSAYSAIVLFPLRGRLNELPDDHSAVGNRTAGLLINIQAAWDSAADDSRNIGWARQAWEACRPFSTGGTYVNLLTEDESGRRIQDAYGANYQRLIDIKAKYDPENVFRLNKNIAPNR